MFTLLDLKAIVADILRIDLQDWLVLTEKRGMRPVKAAIRLGADANKAQLIADLGLAVTAEDIDTVYANESLRSCMVGQKVGDFYSINNIGVIFSKNFRVLVGLETKVLCDSSYGYKRDAICDLMSSYFKEGFMINDTRVEVYEDNKQSFLRYENVKMVRSYFINSTYPWDIPSSWSEEDLKQEFLNLIRSGNNRGEYFTITSSSKSEEEISNSLFYHEPVKDGDFEKTSDSISSYVLYELYEEQVQVYEVLKAKFKGTYLDLKYPEDAYAPYIDFDTLVASEELETVKDGEVIDDCPF